ncbi:MAG: bicyclomycin resistance protein [Rubrivivax sp.]|nr:bicyclomycin resistance protein [Rubrivivax sp.]
MNRLRRRSLLLAPAALGALPFARAQPAAGARKVLRFAANTAESGYDPVRVGDQSSIRVIAHIFEPPLTYDPLADPPRMVPLTAAAMPEVSDDHRRFVVTLQRGILFGDDPAFGGKPRELTAADYVYTIKRHYDPANRTEYLYQFENAKILGLSELRRRVIAEKTPFPYDVEVDGLRALDRYRFEIRLAESAPRFLQVLAGWACGAVAREVIEAYADDTMAHPVGTGPFRLVQWRRASRTVLERNPNFREQRFATVADLDAPGQAARAETARRLQGRRAPLVDRLEFDVIEESQPRWLAFLSGDHDVLTLPSEFGELAMPGGQPAPFLQRLGVQAERALTPSISHTFFNCDDPVVGGYTPEQVALRRAIAIGYDTREEVRLVMRGQAVPAASMIAPHCYGYDAALVSQMGRGDAARANALLDLYGFADRDRDGVRERPDGSALTLRIAFTPDRRARAVSELWLKHMRRLGLRTQFEFAPFAELIKRALAGQLMMWGFQWGAGAPDGDFFLGLAYGPNADQSNDARFKLAEYDRLYERQRVLPDGPERLALMQRANRMMLAWVPYLPHFHQIQTELLHAHVRGPVRHPFNSDWFRWVDIAPDGA